jgi:hypothetical protein
MMNSKRIKECYVCYKNKAVKIVDVSNMEKIAKQLEALKKP